MKNFTWQSYNFLFINTNTINNINKLYILYFLQMFFLAL